MTTELEEWMDDGDPGDADWMPHLLGLAAHGRLGHAGKLLLDLPALSQRWSCVPGSCSPGMRGKRDRSCCADLEVGVSPSEQARIRAAWPEIVAHMADDPRWSGPNPPEPFDDDALTRPGRRCVFAKASKDGLQCGLHQLEDATKRKRGAIKPMPCRLFPLVLVELDEGRYLVTAIHSKTASLAGSRPASAFPCLGATSQTLAAGCEDVLTGLFGRKTAKEVVQQAEDWSTGPA